MSTRTAPLAGRENVIVLLHGPSTAARSRLSLLQAAGSLAAARGGHVEVVDLSFGGEPPAAEWMPPLPPGSSWWDSRDTAGDGLDEARLHARAVQALATVLGPVPQGNAGPSQVCLTPAGGGLGAARPWGRSLAAGAVLVEARDGAQGLAAQLAAHWQAPCLGGCRSVQASEDGWRVQRDTHGGRVLASLQVREAPLIFAVPRPAAAQAPANCGWTPPACRPLPFEDVVASDLPGRWLDAPDPHRALEGAPLVVCGGRGMGGPEGFTALAELAQVLDAALAGSLPAVDAGWVPAARQVGQSGRFVSPRVYLAVGVSGTPQHMAGVADEARIVAINEDPDAAIFQVADVGVVADWRTLLPALLAAAREGGDGATQAGS